MVFCFGIRLALYAFFFFQSALPSTHCTAIESDRPINIVIRDFNGHLPYPFQNPISNFYLSLEAGKSSTDSVILRKLTNVEIIFRAWTKSLKRTKMYFDD